MAKVSSPQKTPSLPELRLVVAEAVKEVLQDPDFGLGLREETKKTLRARLRSPGRRTAFAEIKRKYSRQ